MSEAPAADNPLRIVLNPDRDKRVKAGHLWIFSNEIKEVLSDHPPVPGDLGVVVNAGGTPLGMAFYNPNSLIGGRIISRDPKEPIDAEFFRRKLAEAIAYREKAIPGETSYRLCYGESDGLPGLVVDR